MLSGYVRRLKTERERDAWLAWHTAALSRAERLPRFDRFMGTPEAAKPKKARSWKASKAAARRWVTKAGGEVRGPTGT